MRRPDKGRGTLTCSECGGAKGTYEAARCRACYLARPDKSIRADARLDERIEQARQRARGLSRGNR